MRRPRLSTFNKTVKGAASAAVALALPVTAVGATGPGPVSAAAVHAGSSPAPAAVAIHPSAIPIGPFIATTPPTTADCERRFHVACYQPFQIQRAYDLAPLYSKGIDGRGTTIVIVDSYGSPTIGHDLAVFDHAFGLSPPPSLTVIQPAVPSQR
jgi:subtilase family serine protease